MAVHLYRVNVEFPAARTPRVADPIEVKGTTCVVFEIEARPGDGGDVQALAASVYAEPAA